MKSLRESIFDEENNLEKVEKDVYIRQISNLWDNVKSNPNKFVDRLGRDLKIGDLIYNRVSNDFGIITSLNNPALDQYNKIDVTSFSLDRKYEHDPGDPNNMILIPKSCYKELLKILKTKD